MAVVSEVTSLKIAMLLNVGTTTTGAVKTAAVSLPAIDYANYTEATDDARVMALVTLITPILDRRMHMLRKTVVSQLLEE